MTDQLASIPKENLLYKHNHALNMVANHGDQIEIVMEHGNTVPVATCTTGWTKRFRGMVWKTYGKPEQVPFPARWDAGTVPVGT